MQNAKIGMEGEEIELKKKKIVKEISETGQTMYTYLQLSLLKKLVLWRHNFPINTSLVASNTTGDTLCTNTVQTINKTEIHRVTLRIQGEMPISLLVLCVMISLLCLSLSLSMSNLDIQNCKFHANKNSLADCTVKSRQARNKCESKVYASGCENYN